MMKLNIIRFVWKVGNNMSGISAISSIRYIPVTAGVETAGNVGSTNTKSMAQNIGEALKEADSTSGGEMQNFMDVTGGNLSDPQQLAKLSELMFKKKFNIELASRAGGAFTSCVKTVTQQQ